MSGGDDFTGISEVLDRAVLLDTTQTISSAKTFGTGFTQQFDEGLEIAVGKSVKGDGLLNLNGITGTTLQVNSVDKVVVDTTTTTLTNTNIGTNGILTQTGDFTAKGTTITLQDATPTTHLLQTSTATTLTNTTINLQDNTPTTRFTQNNGATSINNGTIALTGSTGINISNTTGAVRLWSPTLSFGYTPTLTTISDTIALESLKYVSIGFNKDGLGTGNFSLADNNGYGIYANPSTFQLSHPSISLYDGTNERLKQTTTATTLSNTTINLRDSTPTTRFTQTNGTTTITNATINLTGAVVGSSSINASGAIQSTGAGLYANTIVSAGTSITAGTSLLVGSTITSSDTLNLLGANSAGTTRTAESDESTCYIYTDKVYDPTNGVYANPVFNPQMKSYVINMTGGTISSSFAYAIEIECAPTDPYQTTSLQSPMTYIEVTCINNTTATGVNQQTFAGKFRASGTGDGVNTSDFRMSMYDATEPRFISMLCGDTTQTYKSFVLYVVGGFEYRILTNGRVVRHAGYNLTNTNGSWSTRGRLTAPTALGLTYTPVAGTTFAVRKTLAGVDSGGVTTANITTLIANGYLNTEKIAGYTTARALTTHASNTYEIHPRYYIGTPLTSTILPLCSFVVKYYSNTTMRILNSYVTAYLTEPSLFFLANAVDTMNFPFPVVPVLCKIDVDVGTLTGSSGTIAVQARVAPVAPATIYGESASLTIVSGSATRATSLLTTPAVIPANTDIYLYQKMTATTTLPTSTTKKCEITIWFQQLGA
jgi:hypothetical protein